MQQCQTDVERELAFLEKRKKNLPRFFSDWIVWKTRHKMIFCSELEFQNVFRITEDDDCKD